VDPQDQKRKPPSLLSNRPDKATPSQPMPSVQTTYASAPTKPSTTSSPLFFWVAIAVAAILVAVLIFRFVFNREPAELIQDTTLANNPTIKAEPSEDASIGRASVYRAEDIDDIEPNTPVTLPSDTATQAPKDDGQNIARNNLESLKNQSPTTAASSTKPTPLEQALRTANATKPSDSSIVKTTPKAPVSSTKPVPPTAKPAAPLVAAAPASSKTPSTTPINAKVADNPDADIELLESLMDQAKTAPAIEKAKENKTTADEITPKQKTDSTEKLAASAKPPANKEAVAQTKPPTEPTTPAAPERANKRKLVIVSSAEPKYPTAALRAKVTGQVTASMTVDTEGRVSNIKIINAKPRAIFDRSVRDALAQWRFEPIKESQTITRTFDFSPSDLQSNASVIK
jgi:periplasmic protein TonB